MLLDFLDLAKFGLKFKRTSVRGQSSNVHELLVCLLIRKSRQTTNTEKELLFYFRYHHVCCSNGIPGKKINIFFGERGRNSSENSTI